MIQFNYIIKGYSKCVVRNAKVSQGEMGDTIRHSSLDDLRRAKLAKTFSPKQHGEIEISVSGSFAAAEKSCNQV